MRQSIIPILFLSATIALFTSCSSKGKMASTTPITIDTKVMQTDNNQFTFTFFKKANTFDTQTPNIFVSPLSASVLLSMTANGARSATLEQMLSALSYQGTSLASINRYNKILIDSLPRLDKNTTLKIANSIWLNNGLILNKKFTAIAKKDYNAKAATINFSNVESAPTINSWCSKQTNGKIKEIVNPETLNQMRMVLLNALYFKSYWAEQFDTSRTRNDLFTTASLKVSIPMMRKRGDFSLYSGDYFRMLELPYKGDVFVMDIILPNEGISVYDAIENLNAESFGNAIKQQKNQSDVDLKLPKFEIEYETGLNEILQQLGMVDAFNPTKANFTDLSSEPLFISEAKQKAYLKVDEEGTEAAAVTGIMMTRASLSKPYDFYVNRPFILIIREKQNNTILFIGKISDPTLK